MCSNSIASESCAWCGRVVQAESLGGVELWVVEVAVEVGVVVAV